VQQAEGLARALIHGHAGTQEVVTNLKKLDAQVSGGGAGLPGGDFGEGNGSFPDRHGMCRVLQGDGL